MTSSTVRHAYLDWVRGLAVLIMIEAHVIDAWTHAADRTRPLFGYAMILGGFGAPLFLFLAGLAVVLSAESKFRRTGDFASSWWAAQKRGWQVFGLAFLFRLQSYILSGGYSLLSLLKVDILNVMGPAIAVTAMTGRMARTNVMRGVLFAVGACAISLLAPIVRVMPQLAWLPDPDRVVLPAHAHPDQLHALSVGGVRLRGCCRGRGRRRIKGSRTRQASPGDAGRCGCADGVAGAPGVVPTGSVGAHRSTGRRRPRFFSCGWAF